MTESEKRPAFSELCEVLDDWVRINWEQRKLELESGQRVPGKPGSNYEDVVRDAETVKPYLPLLLEDNSARSAEELEEIASKLSPGGIHNGGLLTSLLMGSVGLDPLLITAMIWYNWHGGKVGFQFLPNPAVDPENYYFEVAELEGIIDEGLQGDPLRVLTGDDRDFYLSLPESFTVYRGCLGISAELAGIGLCWTLKRDIAESFALRFKHLGPSVVVTARVRKHRIKFAKAIEQEIVVRPYKSKQIALKHKTIGDLRPR